MHCNGVTDDVFSCSPPPSYCVRAICRQQLTLSSSSLSSSLSTSSSLPSYSGMGALRVTRALLFSPRTGKDRFKSIKKKPSKKWYRRQIYIYIYCICLYICVYTCMNGRVSIDITRYEIWRILFKAKKVSRNRLQAPRMWRQGEAAGFSFPRLFIFEHFAWNANVFFFFFNPLEYPTSSTNCSRWTKIRRKINEMMTDEKSVRSQTITTVPWHG